MRPERFLPALTVSDPDDARVVFDALNDAYVVEPPGERRQRLAALLVAAHTETRRNRTENPR